MKAVVVSEFGSPNVLKLAELPIPQPDRDQVLVRVKAAGVGPWDAWIREGKSVLPQPLPFTPGSDISGTVEGAGSAVGAFRPGHEVYGVTNKRFTGGYAEYALADAGMIALKPRAQCLVHGAAGNVGAYAVQLAHQKA
jgi:NADPH:quinone reductase-like Zn-dependent oxidoreductase